MGRKYVRKTGRQSWGKDSMKAAIRSVRVNKKSVNSAAKEHGIPEPTLRRYLRKYDDEIFPCNAGRFKPTFSEEQLQNLFQYIVAIDKRAFGLTKNQFAKVIYDYAESKKIPHRFCTEKRRAGRHFVEWFMQKYNLSLRCPEATSVARLMAFNRENVIKFFEALRELREKYSFQPHQIYNVDETGVSTVATKNPKIITPKGKRRVVKVSSAERGTNVTAVCCMNASGSFVPPFLIFPRVRMQSSFMNGAPPGSDGVASESGWMTANIFISYLKHFIRNVRPNKESPVLLLMDNHASHVTLEAVNLCRDNNIILLGFPAHTSHRMQPLDVSLYGPLKTAYSRACEDFLSSNPGRVISLFDIASLFGRAYLKVATISNAVSGFKATGIEPFNSQIFSDDDFEAAATTERDIGTPRSEINEQSNKVEEKAIEESDMQQPSTSGVCCLLSNSEPRKTPKKDNRENISNEEVACGLPSLPRAESKTRRPRKKLPSLVISSTPVKDALEEKRKEKIKKEQIKREKDLQKTKEKDARKKSVKLKPKKSTTKRVNRQIFNDDSSDSESSTNISYVDTDADVDPEEDDKTCLICDDLGKDNELWFQCYTCKLWAHSECTELSLKESKLKTWFCYRCNI